MNPLLGVLVVLLTLQAIAFVIAIISRYWVLRTETFEMRGIDVDRATDLVAVYIEGVHDHRFGFPTGVFAVDADRTSPGTVIAREINFKGSAGMGPIKFGLRLPFLGAMAGMAMMGEADDPGGCAVGLMAAMIGATIGLFAAAVLIVPFAFLAIVEVLLRMLMQGAITARIDKIPDAEDMVRVKFELRGLSAFGIEHQLRKGMAPPKPVGATQTVVTTEPAPAATVDRLNAIYLSGVSVGLILSVVAFIVIGNSQPGSSDVASASYSYEEPYEEEGYEEEYDEEPYEDEEYEEEGEYSEGPSTRYEAARNMYLRYWREIDAGDYGAGYNVYYHTFETEQGISKGEFVEAEEEYLPDVGLDHIRLEPSSRNPTNSNELWLYAEIPIADQAGPYTGVCRVFSGDLRMFHANGRWYYRPGEAFGRTPSFGAEGGGPRTLPRYSERCS